MVCGGGKKAQIGLNFVVVVESNIGETTMKFRAREYSNNIGVVTEGHRAQRREGCESLYHHFAWQSH